MEDTRVLTLKALDEFVAAQSALLAQTLGDIDRLRELKSDLVDDDPPFSNADELDEWLIKRLDDPSFRLSERAEECRMKIPRDISCNWAIFEGCDPAPLHALTLQAQHAYAQRNIPPTTQTSPLSDLQLLVKGARRTIVDPVLALFADLSDGEDEELTAEGKKEREEARQREREREKIRELKRRKIRAWGGLSLPSSSGGKVKGEDGGVFIRRDVDDESMDVDIGDGEMDGCELTRSVGMMPPPLGPDAPRSRKPSRKAKPQVSEEEKEGEEQDEEEERPRKKARLPNLKSTPNANGNANAKEKANGKDKTKTKGKEKKPKPQPDTYKQAWSVSEQHLLEQLLEQIPEGERFRWQKISRAMNGTRTPRQVASRVQKYFEKLKKFGVEGY